MWMHVADRGSDSRNELTAFLRDAAEVAMFYPFSQFCEIDVVPSEPAKAAKSSAMKQMCSN